MSVFGYSVIGSVKTTVGTFPLLDIPMMSDERWQELARENAVHNYVLEYGQEPESVDTAVEWQRKWIKEKQME